MGTATATFYSTLHLLFSEVSNPSIHYKFFATSPDPDVRPTLPPLGQRAAGYLCCNVATVIHSHSIVTCPYRGKDESVWRCNNAAERSFPNFCREKQLHDIFMWPMGYKLAVHFNDPIAKFEPGTLRLPAVVEHRSIVTKAFL